MSKFWIQVNQEKGECLGEGILGKENTVSKELVEREAWHSKGMEWKVVLPGSQRAKNLWLKINVKNINENQSEIWEIISVLIRDEDHFDMTTFILKTFFLYFVVENILNYQLEG